MQKEVNDFIIEWNKFIEAILIAQVHWETMRKLKVDYNLTSEKFPDACQRVLARVNIKARFVVGIGRFLEYVTKYASIESCLIKQKKIKGGGKECLIQLEK